MQNYILYQAYGGIDYLNECRFSLLKYLSVYNLKPPASTSVVIYTDTPAAFETFTPFFKGFEMRTVEKEEIKKWRGHTQFVHRVKVEIITDFFNNHTGNVLYFDTDTYATETIEPLFSAVEKGIYFMHEYEGVIDKNGNPFFYKWEDFLRNTSIEYNGKKFSFYPNIKVWNAGVVGLNSTSNLLLADVLSLTDVVYKQFPKHIAEQFAFSYCFQQAGAVQSASRAVVHYWNLKEFRVLLHAFFKKNEEESIPNLIKMSHHLDPVKIQQDKEQFLKLSLLKKWMQQLSGKGWSIKQYQNKI